jgi:hypothetical protein
MRSSVARGSESTSLITDFGVAAVAVSARVQSARLAELGELLQSYDDAQLTDGIGYSMDLQRALGCVVSGIQAARPATWISRARLGIAVTGTAVVAERRAEDRKCALLCTRHVLVMPSSRILATLEEAAERVRSYVNAGLGYVTFITGPSRTSDIEKVLTLGAHGPAELDIILVDDWEPEDD